MHHLPAMMWTCLRMNDNQVFHWISPNHPIWGPELSSCLTSMIPAWECWGVGIECSIIAAQLNQTTVAALHWWVPSYRCRHQQHLCDFMMYQQRCPFPRAAFTQPGRCSVHLKTTRMVDVRGLSSKYFTFIFVGLRSTCWKLTKQNDMEVNSQQLVHTVGGRNPAPVEVCSLFHYL